MKGRVKSLRIKSVKNKNKALDHALLMVGRNKKSYVLLSVTIILSFSLLLGFFVWTDSQMYNKYKDIFSVSPNVAALFDAYSSFSTPDLGYDITNERYSIMMDKMDDMDNTYYYQYYMSDLQLTQYEDKNHSFSAKIIYLPNDFFGFYDNISEKAYLKKINIICGESNFSSDDGVIINRNFYDILYKEQGKTAVTVDIPVETSDGIFEIKTFKVIGISENTSDSFGTDFVNPDGTVHYYNYTTIFMPQTAAKEFDSSFYNRRMLIYSESNMPEIYSLFRDLNIGGNANYRYLQEAYEEIQDLVFLKGMSAMILFVLLGINLFSSFKNALNERRFEIGVKRAIGAGKKSIVGQFFREGMIVMLSNIAFSIYLIFSLAVIYKTIQKHFFDTTWTIDLSPYSAVIFLFSAFFLSVSFSLIFAYQSTNVEIASHLKAE